MYELKEKKERCEYQDVVVEVLTVLIHKEAGFQGQMQGRMPAGMGWEDVSRYWGQRVRFGGINMYQMIVKIWDGSALSEIEKRDS